MNQRQKKKTSQNRKRHFEGLKAKEAKEAHASGAQRKQHKEQAKPHTPATESQHHNVVVKVEDEQSVDHKTKELDVRVEDQKKFSRRKIVSNWSKYDEERTDMFDSTLHQDSEEALQDRLLQLFNLPTTHTTPSLTDIGDVSSVSNSTPELEESSNFLTLDCNALAKALSTLPLYQLLDIDPEVLGEKDEMENPPQNKLDSVHIGLPSSSPATVASLRGTSEAADVFDLSQSLRKVAVVKEEASGEEDVGMCSVSSSQIRKESSPLARQQPHTKPSAATASSTDEDKRLDKLLSTSETNPPSQKYTRTTAKRVDEQGPTKIAMADSLHPPTTISAGEDENSELDDMLDELLA